MTRAQKMVAEALMVIGLLAAVWVAVGRVMVEQMGGNVGIAVDWQEVRELAAVEGLTPRDVLSAMKEAGATHLAVAEDSLADVTDRGEVTLFSKGDVVELWAANSVTLQRVARGLQARFPGVYQKTDTPEGETWLTVPKQAVSMPSAGVGYPEEALTASAIVDLALVARPRADGVRTAAATRNVMMMTHDSGADIVVFDGEEVVGHPGHLDVTAAQLRQQGLKFGMIELAPQLGASQLAAELDYDLIRVHSITEQEMRTMSVDRATERFVRAAKERGVRLLYLRMLPTSEMGPLEGNIRYVRSVVARLRAEGMTVGAPRPFARFSTEPWLLAVVQLGVVGAALWLLQALFGLPGRCFWPIAVLLVVGGAAATLVAADLGRTLLALAAAVLYPTIAVCYASRGAVGEVEGKPRLGEAILPVIGAFMIVCVVSAFGGLLVVGLLGDSAYLTKVAQFRGVKVAQVVPILAAAIIWLARSTDVYRQRVEGIGEEMVDYHSGETVPEWPALWVGLKEAMRGVVAYWHVAAAFAGLVVVAMLLLRSGNEAAGAVLPGEMELRALLDRVLIVRPRTKEVFLGHPAMLLGLLLAMRRVRRGLWIAFAVGAIGQISLVNSFCHVHTPLLLTLLRVMNGIWVGALGGLVVCWLWDAFGGAPEPSPEPHAEAPIADEDEV